MCTFQRMLERWNHFKRQCASGNWYERQGRVRGLLSKGRVRVDERVDSDGENDRQREGERGSETRGANGRGKEER